MTGTVAQQYSFVVARRSHNTNRMAFIAFALIAIGAVSFFIGMRGPHFISIAGKGPLGIPTGLLGRGQVRFYSYRDRAGDELRFILARDSGGELHAAMDACRSCYTYHKGYTTLNGYLICKFCGNRYKLSAMPAGLASCVPVKLSFKTDGQFAKVDTAELERNRQLF